GEACDAVRGLLAGRSVAGQAVAAAAAGQAECDRVVLVVVVLGPLAFALFPYTTLFRSPVGRVGGVRLDAEGELVRAGVLDREVVADGRTGVVESRYDVTCRRLVDGGIDGGDAVREVGCVVEGDRGHAGAGAARAVVEVA